MTATNQPSRWMAALCISLFLSNLPLSGQSAAQVVRSDNEFQVYRDFTRMALPKADAKEKPFFFDVDGLVERTTLPRDEAHDVGRTAIELLGSTFRLVSSKTEASYLIQIRVDRSINFAIRNPKRELARGLVMISLCHWPIRDVATDCGNLTFYYFGVFQGVEVLKKVFPMWLSMTLQSK